jgi:cytochrome P450
VLLFTVGSEGDVRPFVALAARLRAQGHDPVLAEILRCEPPVQLVARAALRPVELEGRPVPAGSMIFGLIAAGNRDPAQFKRRRSST